MISLCAVRLIAPIAIGGLVGLRVASCKLRVAGIELAVREGKLITYLTTA